MDQDVVFVLPVPFLNLIKIPTARASALYLVESSKCYARHLLFRQQIHSFTLIRIFPTIIDRYSEFLHELNHILLLNPSQGKIMGCNFLLFSTLTGFKMTCLDHSHASLQAEACSAPFETHLSLEIKSPQSVQ